MKKGIIKTVISLSLISMILVSFSAQFYAATNVSVPDMPDNSSFVYSRAREPASVSVRFSNKASPHIEGKLISNTTYVALRSFLNSIGVFNIKWSQKSKTATAVSENVTISVQIDKYELFVNDRKIYMIAENKLIENTTYVPIRPLAEALGYEVSWTQSTKTVILSKTSSGSGDVPEDGTLGTYGQFSARADSYYDYDDLYWLSRIISAEARGESIEGMLAVGSVVMNRMNHKNYPNSVKEVIFDDKYGIQFTPVANGYVYKDPTDKSIFAAKIVLEGYRINNEIIYFVDTKISPNSWVERNNTFVFKIGCHSFFK